MFNKNITTTNSLDMIYFNYLLKLLFSICKANCSKTYVIQSDKIKFSTFKMLPKIFSTGLCEVATFMIDLEH